MRRKAEIDLLKWYQKKDRKPLILRGARQVGKSTLVRLFAQNQGLDLLEVNLELTTLKSLNQTSLKLTAVLDEIQLTANKKIHEKTLLFFDEIQDEPKLLQFLRYFYEERPDLSVVVAGSLLEIALKNEDFSFPVGRVEFYYLGPMEFDEFLEACGQQILLEKLASFDLSEAVKNLAHDFLNKFFYIGGLPKAVLCYSKEQSLVGVREIHQEIIQSYIADFPKYSKRIDVKKMGRVFTSSALNIGKKVKYQALDSESKSREIKRAVEFLIDARLLLPCYHCEASGVPLLATQDYGTYKNYFIDIGLLNSIHQISYNTLVEESSSGFLTKGVLAEQFVAQHINAIKGHSQPPELNYWLRDRGSQKGEIDFILEFNEMILPIEVKSNVGGQLKSLFYFCHEKSIKNAIKISTQDLKNETIQHKILDRVVEIQLCSFPLYLVPWFKNFLLKNPH